MPITKSFYSPRWDNRDYEVKDTAAWRIVKKLLIQIKTTEMETLLGKDADEGFFMKPIGETISAFSS